jgi:hypothetical protein
MSHLPTELWVQLKWTDLLKLGLKSLLFQGTLVVIPQEHLSMTSWSNWEDDWHQQGLSRGRFCQCRAVGKELENWTGSGQENG